MSAPQRPLRAHLANLGPRLCSRTVCPSQSRSLPVFFQSSGSRAGESWSSRAGGGPENNYRKKRIFKFLLTHAYPKNLAVVQKGFFRVVKCRLQFVTFRCFATGHFEHFLSIVKKELSNSGVRTLPRKTLRLFQKAFPSCETKCFATGHFCPPHRTFSALFNQLSEQFESVWGHHYCVSQGALKLRPGSIWL